MTTDKQGNDLPKLAPPALRALAWAKIAILSQLSKKTEAEVTALHGMGPNALAILKTGIKAMELKSDVSSVLLRRHGATARRKTTLDPVADEAVGA
jgi:predicted Fe-Mo cluster-binding NifX family protein